MGGHTTQAVLPLSWRWIFEITQHEHVAKNHLAKPGILYALLYFCNGQEPIEDK
jgi:hypothetical protein